MSNLVYTIEMLRGSKTLKVGNLATTSHNYKYVVVIYLILFLIYDVQNLEVLIQEYDGYTVNAPELTFETISK